MSPEMFDDFKKHLPKEVRKQVEARQAKLIELQEERERERELKLSEILDSETMMRFGYVPFVIAALAWDYADSILNMAAYLRIQKVKRLCRSVKELKKDYDYLRAPYIDQAHQQSEENNMYVFEDGVNDVFNLYLADIGFDIKSEYPNLDHEYVLYLKAIYQCHIVLKSIFRYAQIQTSKVEKIVGHKIGDIIPSQLRKLDTLIMAFIGDKPVSKKFEAQQATYAETLANRMCQIELCENEDECK